MPSAFTTTVEGRTTLYVPADSLGSAAPETFPVFFNPAARLNRDVSVAVVSATRPADLLDSLAGIGARGVRVANEAGTGTRVTMVDFNRRALAIAEGNVRKNGLEERCSVVHSETNAFLYSRFERQEKFGAVDVDPFGTPAPYLQAALVASADGAILSFTATDAAVLCGVYPAVALRRYGAAAPRSEFVHETAIRVLVGFAARMGGINDIGVSPVLAHSTLHYFRVYLRVARGATAADDSQGQMGYVTQCNGCGSRSSGPEPLTRCPECGGKARPAGPLWTGTLCERDVVEEARSFCAERGLEEAAGVLASLVGLEAYPPFSYSLERVASRLRVPSAPLERVVEALRSSGHACMRQPYEEVSVKTDAGYADVEKAVAAVSRKLA